MPFDKNMQKALAADGEKLRAMTGEDHGPYFLPEPDNVQFCRKCNCVTWHVGQTCEWSDLHRVK